MQHGKIFLLLQMLLVLCQLSMRTNQVADALKILVDEKERSRLLVASFFLAKNCMILKGFVLDRVKVFCRTACLNKISAC